jgi:hypothetical protein
LKKSLCSASWWCRRSRRSQMGWSILSNTLQLVGMTGDPVLLRTRFFESRLKLIRLCIPRTLSRRATWSRTRVGRSCFSSSFVSPWIDKIVTAIPIAAVRAAVHGLRPTAASEGTIDFLQSLTHLYDSVRTGRNKMSKISWFQNSETTAKIGRLCLRKMRRISM